MDPRETACADACDHVLSVTSPEEPEERAVGWLGRCVAACLEHGSEGQLACYARVRKAADVHACMVD